MLSPLTRSPSPLGRARTAAGAPASVSPSTLSGLVLWLVGDSVAGSDGGPASAWPDSGPLNRDVHQADGTLRPVIRRNRINGHTSIEFNGTANEMDTAPFAIVPTTVFSVYRKAVGTTAPILGGVSVNGVIDHADSNLYIVSDVVELLGCPFADAGGTWDISAWREGATVYDCWKNAVHAVGGSAPTGSVLTVSEIGRRGGGDTVSGEIAEVVVYDRALTDAEVGQIRAYLNEKYLVY